MSKWTRKGKIREQVKTQGGYSLCVAGYYLSGGNPDQVVRMTAVVVDLTTDKAVERLESIPNREDQEHFMDQVIALSKKYSTPITAISEAVPLEKCPCGNCDGYLDRLITSKDIALRAQSVN